MKQRLYGHVYIDCRLGLFFLNVYLRGCVSVCLSVRPLFCLCVYMSVYTCVGVGLFVYPSVRPSTGVALGGLPNYLLDFGSERVNAATGMFHLSQI